MITHLRPRPAFTALTFACLLVATSAAAQDPVSYPGMGYSHAEPEGAPFELPEGLTLEAPSRGYNTSDPEDCDYKYQEEGVGKGEQVRLCLILNNTTSEPLTLMLPPGLIFVSRNRKTQNGMIAQRIFIEVPAKTRYFQPLFAYCINSSRDSVAGDSEYDLGPVTQIPAFVEVFRLIEGKAITDTNFVVVNQSIGNLADGEELSPELIEELEAL